MVKFWENLKIWGNWRNSEKIGEFGGNVGEIWNIFRRNFGTIWEKMGDLGEIWGKLGNLGESRGNF